MPCVSVYYRTYTVWTSKKHGASPVFPSNVSPNWQALTTRRSLIWKQAETEDQLTKRL